MKTILNLLEETFKEATFKAFPELQNGHSTATIEITQSSSDKFGSYQFNSAMKLTKLVQKNPRQIAEQIVSHIQTNSFISKLEVAGPGFINITIDKKFLEERITAIFNDPFLGIDRPLKKQKIIIDFSSPNTAKEMHVGHLRSTIIGDCLARLFEFMGDDVLRLNHIGDWGTAFGMLIAYMKKNVPEVLEGKEKTDLPKLMAMYKLSKQQFDQDPDFKKASQQQVVALQGGEQSALDAWKIICDISRKGYQEIYDLLDVKLQERGESFYNPILGDIVQELEEKGVVQISNGAKCIFLEGFQNREGEPLPLMIQKSDGGYNYDTTDMAAMKQRIDVEKGDRLIYVTDAGQATHFEMIFKAAEKAEILDPKKVKVDHVPFGMVLGLDGKKFKTRSGETEKLIDLITAAITQAETILQEKNPGIEQAELKHLGKALGIGAIKYADLSCNRVGDYTFSYERMLRFEGNTAAFLMYSYVRIAGIKRKTSIDINELKNSSKIHLEHPSEIALGLHLTQFGETINVLAKDLLPNRLTDYLYNLAEKFNAFYRDCPVIGSKEQNSRLLLAEACAIIMKKGLEILGLQVVDKM
jgi:arginyl-tRNA synthetase